MGQAKAELIRGFQTEHTHLNEGLSGLTDVLDRLREGVDVGALKGLRDARQFLRAEFIPHAEWEELTFYPGVGELVRKHGDVNATMLIDHREILARIEEFLKLTGRIEGGADDPALLDRARILGYQIRALVDVHCLKEEEVYCALLHRYLTDDEVVHALAIGDQMGHD